MEFVSEVERSTSKKLGGSLGDSLVCDLLGLQIQGGSEINPDDSCGVCVFCSSPSDQALCIPSRYHAFPGGSVGTWCLFKTSAISSGLSWQRDWLDVATGKF